MESRDELKRKLTEVGLDVDSPQIVQLARACYRIERALTFDEQIPIDGKEARWDLPLDRFIAAARDWVLLLQVDTDDYKEGPGWMWGDAGMVYFWIHRDDLASQAFDKTIAIEQCH